MTKQRSTKQPDRSPGGQETSGGGYMVPLESPGGPRRPGEYEEGIGTLSELGLFGRGKPKPKGKKK